MSSTFIVFSLVRLVDVLSEQAELPYEQVIKLFYPFLSHALILRTAGKFPKIETGNATNKKQK
jgi:hypothetical protein